MIQTLQSEDIARLDSVRKSLEAFASARPDKVIRKIGAGDRIRKSLMFDYEMDVCDINAALGVSGQEGFFPYGIIYGHFNSDGGAIMSLFQSRGVMKDHRLVLPFSQVVGARIGQCAEKSIATQLHLQDRVDSFYIDGSLVPGEGEFAGHHAFNVILSKKKGPLLVDVENPLLVDDANGRKLVPYIVPILGVTRDGDFELNKDPKDERVYGIM